MKKKLTIKELRERAKVMKTLQKSGLSERAIAKKLKCSRSTVWYWLNV